MSNKLSSCVKFLSNRFASIFSVESLKNLVANDKISYEAAAVAMSNITNNGGEGIKSIEGKVETVEMNTDQKKIITEKALQKYFEGAKFEAMLEAIKEDDTLLATEFNNVDDARSRIMAEIVKKEEHNFNTLLDELKTTGGTNQKILDKLVQTQVSVDDVKY